MQQLPNETLSSLLSLTWEAVRLVFSKPKIVIAYLLTCFVIFIATLFLFSMFLYPFLNYLFDDFFIKTLIICLYFVSFSSISCIFSLNIIRIHNNSDSVITNLVSFFSDRPLFFKTCRFVFYRNSTIGIPLILYITCLQIAFFFTSSPNDHGLSQAITWFILTGVLALFIIPYILIYTIPSRVNGVMTVPYGIIGGYDPSIASMKSELFVKGSRLSISTHLQIISSPVVALVLIIGHSLLNARLGTGSLIMLCCISIIMLLFDIIYSTNINLLYFKRTKVNQ